MVFFLRPRIGEIDVQHRHRMRREQIFQEIGRFDTHAAQIRQSGATALAIQLAQSAQQAFDANEILFRVSPGLFDQK